MKRKKILGIMLTLFLIGMLMSAFNIQPVKASGTIYIRADGSIEPLTANITSADNVTYYFTDNNYDEIVVERSNIIVDGNGYTLQGSGSGYGFDLPVTSNVTIQNTNIIDFYSGVSLALSSYCAVSGNNITNNHAGIRFDRSTNNIVYGNNITKNDIGLGGSRSNYNNIYGNNISSNTDFGISMGSSSHIVISGNNMENNGIYFNWAWNNTISGNNITNNYYGIRLSSSASFNTIHGNNIKNHTMGFSIWESSQNSLYGNNIEANDEEGIGLYLSSNYNIISENNITNNGMGIRTLSVSNNKIYHNNFINNTVQASSKPGYSNDWDDGYPSGGNYWSNYTDVDLYGGPYQNEIGSDGIWDEPYVIGEDNTDKYPFVNPWGAALYNVTIKAHCNTEGLDVSVNIIVDGSPIGNTTPHIFTNLTGTHTFAVPNTDSNGHPFKQWNTGQTTTTITVSINGTYTAYYQARYNLTVTTTTGGTTNPSPGTHMYWDGTEVNFTAIPSLGYVLDHWELDEINVGAANPINVTMNKNHTLHAVFSSVGICNLTITTTTGGTTNPTPGTYHCTNGTMVSVTAIPDTGYTLDYWELDGANVGSVNPYLVLMDNNHTLHAVFATYDIAITNVTPFKTVVGEGYSMFINVTVENQGSYTETFNVTAYAELNMTVTGDEISIGIQNVTLASGSSTTITFTWNTTDVPKGNYTIWAYAWPVPGDIDTGDNTYTDGTVLITIPGDINGDRKVDGKDIAVMSKFFGCRKEQPCYVPNADINCDGKIDGKDIAIASKHFAQIDP